MSEVLRVYDPPECDADGVPLDWERCRACESSGVAQPRSRRDYGDGACPGCAGHGSLKAAALWAVYQRQTGNAGAVAANAAGKKIAWLPPCRCEGCGHPMGEDVWVNQDPFYRDDARIAAYALLDLLKGIEPAIERTHFSPCDPGCDHGGKVRAEIPVKMMTEPFVETPTNRAAMVAEGQRVEAAWRAVDVRLLGWPHDLRLERLAVLCLRCWAERSKTT